MPISRLFSLLKKFCCVYIKGQFGNVVLVFFGIRVDEKVLWKYMLCCLNNKNCCLNTPTKHPRIFSTRLELIVGEGIFFGGEGGVFHLVKSYPFHNKKENFFFSLMIGHIHSSVQFWIYTPETRRDSGHLDHPPSPLVTYCPIHTKKSSYFSSFFSLKTDWSFIIQRVCLGSVYLAKTKNFLLKVQ